MVTRLYGVAGIPLQYIMDRDGKIVAITNDGYNPADHTLDQVLRKLGVTGLLTSIDRQAL